MEQERTAVAGEHAEDESSLDEAAADKPKQRSGRGRRRRRKAEVSEAEPDSPRAAAAADAEDAAAVEADDGGDELDNLADWNVPSWNELIASLYRPER
jgi:hypothetical protein